MQIKWFEYGHEIHTDIQIAKSMRNETQSFKNI